MACCRVIAAITAISSLTATLAQGEDKGSVVYFDAGEKSPALNREAKKAYAGKFRVEEASAKNGYYPGGMKGFFTSSLRFQDPRSMREAEIVGKISFAFVVTPDGKVTEPRILSSTDPRVSKYIIEKIRYERWFPARLRGTPVSSLHVGEWKFGGPESKSKASGDGLGIAQPR